MARDNHDKLYELLMSIENRLGSLDQKLDDVVIQTTKTNGRVTALEAKVSEHTSIIDNWKGRLAIIVIVGGFLFDTLKDWFKAKFL